MFGSSQSFGYGDAGTTQSFATPDVAQKRPARQEERQTCVPVTVRVLQDALAEQNAGDGELQIHGSEAGSLALVGVVENLVEQATVIEFTLNDASGRMKIRQFDATVTGLSDGRYVSVVGSLRRSPAVHVSAMCLRAVDSADEVSYHMVEVAHAALKLRQGPGSTSTSAGTSQSQVPETSMTPAPKQRSPELPTPTKEVADVPMRPLDAAAAAPTPAEVRPAEKSELHGADLRAAILNVLQREGDAAGETGFALTTLQTKINGMAPMERIRDMISQMVTDGDAFTTIDDDHVSAI